MQSAEFLIPSPIEQIHDELFLEKNLNVFIKRDDLIHPVISGNKWRKLKFNIEKAQSEGISKLLTFGGAYSNHIAAFAEVCKIYKIQGYSVIRGERPLVLSSTLEDALSKGVELIFVSREEYRQKSSSEFIQKIINQIGEPVFIIPEGGANEYGVRGIREILSEIEENFDFIACSCGTGTSLEGLLSSSHTVIGFSALKADGYFEKVIENPAGTFEIKYDYHFGGYAKVTKTLLDFMDDFFKKHHILLDPVYTGKMVYGLFDLIKKGYFRSGSSIMVLHTGGLQGRRGFGL